MEMLKEASQTNNNNKEKYLEVIIVCKGLLLLSLVT